MLKSQPEDFQVDEMLPFSPSGEGEHLFLRIRKTGINTGFLAQQIAKFYKVRDVDVSYAGRKDKHAVTTQWFSVWLPGKPDEQIADFHYENCDLIQRTRHNKKLRTGSVERNRFFIKLRDVEPGADLDNRIASIKALGVPNYFGQQRFGNINQEGVAGNLVLANYLLKGETIRKREKRAMAISVLRSWLFNEFTSERIKQWQLSPQPGDAMSLSGSNSFFIADAIDEEILNRMNERDIHITAPMWGKGEVPTTGNVAQFENNIAQQFSDLCRTLESQDLKQERRKLLLIPEQLTWQLREDVLDLQFSLPAGCFATSVIRELLRLKSV